MAYNASYIGPLDSVLNYPYFFTMRDLWIYKKSLYGVRTFYNNWLKQVTYE